MQEFLTKKSNIQDLIIAFCLFLIALITRIPFANRMIYDGDSARFALAMKNYDVSQMRPHAPGYILYVALSKLIDIFIHDVRLSLVSVSILSSVLSVVILYFLAMKMFDRSNGVISALLFLSCPLFWFNSEMPFTYALEGLLCLIFAFICYKIIDGEKRWLLVTATILGLAGGVRQHIVFLLLPLWLYVLKRFSFKQILISFFVFGLTCLAWLIPMIILSGGFQRYFAAVEAQFNTCVLHPSSFLFQIKMRGRIFIKFMLYSLTLGLLPMSYYFGRFFRIPSIMEDIRLKYMILWFVPPVLFFIGVNLFNSGHVMIILPPLFIFLAESIKALSKDLEEGIKNVVLASKYNLIKFQQILFSYKTITVSLVILLLFINFYIFIFKNTQVSYASIKEGDSHLSELLKLTKENSKPDKTIILVFLYNTQAGFYLPDYLIYCPFPLMFSDSEVPIEAQNVYISFRHQTTPKTYWLPTGFKIKPIDVPQGIEKVILWEKEIAQYYQNSSHPLVEIASCLNETKIYLLEVKPGEKIYYDYHYWSVR